MFTVTGHAWIDGKDTIKLSGSATSRHFWSGLPHALGRGPLRVDASLYVARWPSCRCWPSGTTGPIWRDCKPMDGAVREDIGLLSPTPRNVAKANVAFPASFRRVPDSSFGGPVWPYITGG